MSLVANDLSIFILTFDRPDLLEVQLNSVLCQSCRPDIVTVLDNGGMSETKGVVERRADQGARYVDTTSRGRLGNMLMAKELAQGRYLTLLHDDDALHPRYFEFVLQVLNSNADKPIRLVTCNYSTQPVNEFKFSSAPPDASGLVMKRPDYASFLLNCYSGFPFAIYLTEAYRSLDVEDLWRRCGKYLDIPMMLDIVGECGCAAFLSYPFAVYGMHARQDVKDPTTLPEPQAWIELVNSYIGALSKDLRTLSGVTSVIFRRRMLRTGYVHRCRKTISRDEYLCCAKKILGSDPHPVLSWMWSRRVVQKIFTRIVMRIFMSRVAGIGSR